MGSYTEQAKSILEQLTLEEKVAQLTQMISGFHSYQRTGDTFELTNEFKEFVNKYGAMGAMSTLLRSDGYTKNGWGKGIEPHQRVKVVNALQRYVMEHARVPIPVMLELEASHGLQALGSEVFPTNLGMGCMFNRELYGKVMESIGKEMELSGNHVALVTMLDMARDPRWGRTEEFYSEDPFLASEYTETGIKAFKRHRALICCKHYVGTGDGIGGLNTAEVSIGKRELYDIHLASSERAVKAGADMFMVAYNAIDGIPMHAHQHMIREVLRDEFGFEGIVISDGFAVKNTIKYLGMDDEQGAVMMLKAGVDLSLADNEGCYLKLIEACQKGLVDIADIDASVLRILEKKYELGLFDNPYLEDDDKVVNYIDSKEQAQLSYEAACESMVLLKNNGILPLDKTKKIALFGVHADNIYHTLGDYTAYQKVDECMTMRKRFSQGFASAEYTNGWSFRGSDADFNRAVKQLEQCDVAIVTVGGTSTSMEEAVRDKNTGATISQRGFRDCGEGTDVSDVSLPGNQTEFIRRLKETGKPVVLLLVGGRPYAMREANGMADAVIACWYPGIRGADAIYDILTGRVNPSGKLSVSMPYDSHSLPCYYNKYGPMNRNYYSNLIRPALYPFGYGLSYSTFEYSNLEVTQVGKNEFHVEVDVTNTSKIPGKEVVQLYIHGVGNSVLRRLLELKGFEKVYLLPEETKRVSFFLGRNELKIFSAEEQYVVEAGTVEILVGSDRMSMLKTSIQTVGE